MRTKSVKYNLISAALMTAAAMAPDYILKLFGISKVAVDYEFTPLLYAMFLSATFIHRAFFYGLAAALFLIDAVELHYMAYFGFPMHIFDVGNVFKEAAEIAETGLSSWRFVWYVLPIMLICYLAAIRVFLGHAPRFRRSRWMALLFLCSTLYIPRKTFNHGFASFYPWATRASLHNAYNVFSWYLLQPTPSMEKLSFEPYKITHAPKARKPKNIFIFLGESLNRNQFGLYGYGRPTSPRLSKLAREERDFIVKKGISSTPATKDSLPFLFNATGEACNLKQIASGESNLFRLAKQAGYKTTYISTQDSRNLDGQSLKYIDDLQAKEKNYIAVTLARDEFVFDKMDAIDWDKGGNFVVFFTRAIHSPYERTYQHRPEFRQYSEDASGRDEFLKNTYDNSVLYYDDLVANVIARLKEKSPEDTAFYFSSDHGEMLGADGVYGHFVLYPGVFEIPFAYYSIGIAGNPVPAKMRGWEHITHHRLGQLVLFQMGYTLKSPYHEENVFYENGANAWENCRFFRVKEAGGRLEFSPELDERYWEGRLGR